MFILYNWIPFCISFLTSPYKTYISTLKKNWKLGIKGKLIIIYGKMGKSQGQLRCFRVFVKKYFIKRYEFYSRLLHIPVYLFILNHTYNQTFNQILWILAYGFVHSLGGCCFFLDMYIGMKNKRNVWKNTKKLGEYSFVHKHEQNS